MDCILQGICRSPVERVVWHVLEMASLPKVPIASASSTEDNNT
jgi:hypothetical protein